jgi:hypothetical protein
MNMGSSIDAGLTHVLRTHLELCEQALALITSEKQSLAGQEGPDAFTFCQRRKGLLAAIQGSLNDIRQWRQTWQQISPDERAQLPEAAQLFQSIQGSMMKILIMDRENQQAMLRRGLIPAQNLPAAASQQTHYVAGLYRRHCAQ